MRAPRLEALQARRLRLHRLDPSRPLRDARSAAAFIRERRIVMSTGRSSLPLLSEAIAGRPLAGSWMAHPEVNRIYKILGGLRKQDVIAAPLILGKEVLMTPALGPAVERVARDPERRGEVRRRLPPLARRLLEAVEAEGRVRMDQWDVPTLRARPARMRLERELLVVGSEIHTEGGYHTSIVKPWRAGKIAGRVSAEAGDLTFDEARDTLLLAAVRSAVLAPEKEVRRWLIFGGDRVDVLLACGALRQVRAGARIWITLGTAEGV
ncbi:MAG: hypothetical protein HY334_06385 [Armatimonadetes bacterium]|nr:hypothetical protein [Armatimonadota bacterium]